MRTVEFGSELLYHCCVDILTTKVQWGYGDVEYSDYGDMIAVSEGWNSEEEETLPIKMFCSSDLEQVIVVLGDAASPKVRGDQWYNTGYWFAVKHVV